MRSLPDPSASTGLSGPSRLRTPGRYRGHRVPRQVFRRQSGGPACGGATDWWRRIPAIRLADAHATTTSATYLCEFGWPSSRFGGRLGAVHGLEIPFIFDTLDPNLPLFGPLLGEDPPQQLADTMHAAWIDLLAADGDPGWPRYDLNLRATMRFNTGSQVVDDPRSWERVLWEGLR
jgi:para-nitrobenzyl esterase